MQQYAFINNNTIALIAPLDDTTSRLPYEKIEIEKIDLEKYNQGLDIKLENGKVSFYSGERKRQFDEDVQKLQEEQEKIERAEKFARVYPELLALPTINKNTDKAILEGIEFTDKERGDLTVDYAFNGNLQNQFNYMMAILTNTADEQTLHDAAIALGKINGICEFFGLNPLKIPGMKEFTEAMKILPAKKTNS